MAAVALNKVSKKYGRTAAIHHVDLDVNDGELVVLVGPSGCGKSTLLRLIAGLDDPTEGDVLIGGVRVNDLPPARRGIAMVFQSYALYPHMNAFQNMAFGLEMAKLPRSEIDTRVRRAADMLRIAHLLERRPRELSGGERQRVAIGRAIVREPEVFLFDEPLSNLDAALRVETRVELAKLHAETGATMIHVTHDQVEAMTLGERIVVLNDGRVAQVGRPLELYNRPANLFVAGFIGSPRMNFLASEIAAVEGRRARCKLPGEATLEVPVAGGVLTGDRVTLGIRPEHVRVGGDTARLSARVDLIEQLGDSQLVHVRLGGERLVARAAADARYRPGEAVAIGLVEGKCHLFDHAGRAVTAFTP